MIRGIAVAAGFAVYLGGFLVWAESQPHPNRGPSAQEQADTAFWVAWNAQIAEREKAAAKPPTFTFPHPCGGWAIDYPEKFVARPEENCHTWSERLRIEAGQPPVRNDLPAAFFASGDAGLVSRVTDLEGQVADLKGRVDTLEAAPK